MAQLRNNPDLRAAFEDFALFGAPRAALAAQSPSAAAPRDPVSMDSAKFAKLCRDSGLIDNQSLSLIDVDIIFSKCKPVGKRKLDYAHFQKALLEIARVRQCDVEHVVALIVSTEPGINGTIPEASQIVEKLTDTSLYTGSHRNRFDPVTGQGLGLSGREPVSATADLSAIVSRHNAAKTLGAHPVATATATAATGHRVNSPPLSAGHEMPAVFERLNHVSTFTGTHKHRFTEDGRGRGKAGRE
ncbi:Tubulin polymerization-promoting protein member 2 [Entophlyctis sp. JEL0112]|nr:Tubulin polymerization-promoting protein member 2 [Entophlyctis sp. JEL0112]